MTGRWERAEGLALPAVEAEPRTRRRAWLPVARVFGVLLATGVAGALVAALVLPVVGGVAALTRLSGDVLQPVDSALLDVDPLSNTKLLAADGSLLTEIHRRNRSVVPSEAIAPVMKDALVAIEDARFHEHRGVDGEGLVRAMVRNLAAGDVVEGGSTLTQQLVKQIRVQSADTPEERREATDESLGRKVEEAQLALAMEERYSKDEILTRYLNRVYFGAGAYGVHEAAEVYFGVTPAELTVAQAATLAGLVQRPADHDPFVHPDRATERRDVVIDRMLELGMIDRAAAEEARSQPVALSPIFSPNGCPDSRFPFFCDYAVAYLTGTLGLTRQQLEAGGLTVRTTIDPRIQAAGDAAVNRSLAMDDPRAGIYTVVEPGTGRVLGMSVNRMYGLDAADPRQTTVNLNTAAGQGSGSTYKLFTAAAALEQGFGLLHRIQTGDPYVSRVYRDGEEPYDIGNVGRIPSDLTMEEALYRSSNTYFLALQDQLGSVTAPVRMAQRLGLTSLDPVADRVAAENRGSFTFGAEATSPLALTSAYATIAAGGTRCAPTPIDEVLGPDGQPLTRPDGSPLLQQDRCTPAVVAPGLANALNQALRKDVEPGFPGQTGARAHLPGHQIAGKTGTSQDRFSATFVGWTPQLVASVMMYNPVANQDVGSYGGGIPAQIWRDAMAPVLGARPPAPFPPGDPAYVTGSLQTLPPGCVGAPEDRCLGLLASRGFSGTPVAVDSRRPAGIVVAMDPAPGAPVRTDERVVLQVSNGARYEPPVRTPRPAPPPPPAPAPEPEPTPAPEPEPTPEPTPESTPEPTPQPEPTPGPTPPPGPPSDREPSDPPERSGDAEPSGDPERSGDAERSGDPERSGQRERSAGSESPARSGAPGGPPAPRS
ncbi:penicillin-binding protein [Geodermatophilus sp. YIM 151500]|uniref:penicillin-binding protein n=1 Tax=Geodermatophilus sp. YIM 151500 TaxID=2984531 RepID=UPI0021E43F87|nr:penicillin-binding protein [Geodermatophilus sp. YIM 151500]MCV2491103.1 penicillin-binding protein [Geodermatophilus sp. YIM 151500]